MNITPVNKADVVSLIANGWDRSLRVCGSKQDPMKVDNGVYITSTSAFHNVANFETWYEKIKNRVCNETNGKTLKFYVVSDEKGETAVQEVKEGSNRIITDVSEDEMKVLEEYRKSKLEVKIEEVITDDATIYEVKTMNFCIKEDKVKVNTSDTTYQKSNAGKGFLGGNGYFDMLMDRENAEKLRVFLNNYLR